MAFGAQLANGVQIEIDNGDFRATIEKQPVHDFSDGAVTDEDA